jgi:hypothetical protein
VLDAFRDIVINLVASLIFAWMVQQYRRVKGAAEPSAAADAPANYSPPQVASGTQPVEHPQRVSPPRTSRQQADVSSFKLLTVLSITVGVPFLLGAIVLGVTDEVSNGVSPFITDQMRSRGQYGYVQYWLGFSILGSLEVLFLLLRPWRGRVFGVSLGIALAALLILFGIPASRGSSLF